MARLEDFPRSSQDSEGFREDFVPPNNLVERCDEPLEPIISHVGALSIPEEGAMPDEGVLPSLDLALQGAVKSGGIARRAE